MGTALEANEETNGPLAPSQPAPAVIIPNLGQWPDHVIAMAPVNLGSAFLTATGAIMSRPDVTTALRLVFDGATPTHTSVEGLAGPPIHIQLGDVAGTTQAASHVAVRNLYPGIDVVWYATPAGDLEYDLIVAPGAALDQVQVSFEGANGISTNEAGALQLLWEGAPVQQTFPRVFQPSADGAIDLTAETVALADGAFGYEVDGVRPENVLVVDPLLSFGTYIATASADFVRHAAYAPNGDVIVVGDTSSFTFPVTDDAEEPTSHAAKPAPGTAVPNRREDIFIRQYDDRGALLYSSYFGGNSMDVAQGLDVGPNGGFVVTGVTASTDLRTNGGHFAERIGSTDAFVATFDAAGRLAWASYLGGRHEGSTQDITWGEGVSVAPDGQIYVAGWTRSWDLLTTANAHTPRANERDISTINVLEGFLARFTASGDLGYFSYVGGIGRDYAYGVTAMDDGRAAVFGKTNSVEFPVTPATAFQPAIAKDYSHAGKDMKSPDGYLAIFDTDPADGVGTLEYGTFFGGGLGARLGDTSFWHVATDAIVDASFDDEGHLWLAGHTQSQDIPTTDNALLPAPLAEPSEIVTGFLARLDISGAISGTTSGADSLLYGTYLGGDRLDGEPRIALDGDRIGLAWTSYSDDLHLVDHIQEGTDANDLAYVLVLKGYEEPAPVFATYVGGTCGATLHGAFDVGPAGVLVGGDSCSMDIPTANAEQPWGTRHTYDGWLVSFAATGGTAPCFWDTPLGCMDGTPYEGAIP